MIDRRAVGAILLAAGRSRRFGPEDKLLSPLEGLPVAVHAARGVVELAPSRRIAICPDRDGALARLLAGEGFEIVANPHPERGLSESLRLGIGALSPGPAQAALLCLADMPFVRADHLAALLARCDPDRAPVVASARDGVAMPPALFARSRFAALERASGDQGGRALLESAVLVPAPPGQLDDIDRPADLPPG
ncbi:MAG: nucleotidyltransferase family protein [Sphingopyxis sp.]|uniref:nucleotidyltransferase family protein n=1 Tax=Sphingopyxis sp. TaxID=1908224 RepID=UPI003D6DA847